MLAYRESKTLNPDALAQVKALELETTGYFRECLVSGVTQGRFVVGDVELVAYDLVMLAHMWALKHWFFRDRMTIDDYVAAQLAIVLAAITEQAGGNAAPGSRQTCRLLMARRCRSPGRAPSTPPVAVSVRSDWARSPVCD